MGLLLVANEKCICDDWLCFLLAFGVKYETLCTSWYYLYKLKNVENSLHGKTLLRRCFSRFLNCANKTKLRKASDII